MERKINGLDMNITIVCHKLDLKTGGSNFSLDLIARSLEEIGISVSVITIEPKRNRIDKDLKYDVIIPSGGEFRTRFGMLEKAYKIMRRNKEKTDLFHIFAPNLLPAAGFFRQKNDVPVVGRLNSYTLFCVNHDRMNGECHQNCSTFAKFNHDDNKLLKRIAKLPSYISRTVTEPDLAASIDLLFAVSPTVKNIYTEIGVPEDRVIVRPNFYDPEFGDEKLSETSSFDPPLNTLYVGRLKPAKGVDTLLDAISQTKDTTATVVGSGPAESELQTQCANLGIADRVTFTGRISHEQLPKYYHSADIFVQPSRWPEPFSRTLLESMQCGTPAIVSNVGGSAWAVGDAGQSFPPGDAEALAAIFSELLSNSQQMLTMSNYCSKRLQRFDPTSAVSQLVDEYEMVLANVD